MRIKDMGLEQQQEETLLERAMDHICARCNEDMAFRLLAKANDRITYLRRMEDDFKGLYGRTN